MTGGSNGMNCRVCGAGIRAEAMFCGGCGSAARHPGWMDASLDRSVPRSQAGASDRTGMPERAAVPTRGRVSSGSGWAGPPSGGERARQAPMPGYETTVRTGGDRPADPQPAPVDPRALELRPETGAEPEPGLGAELWEPAEREPDPEPAWLREPDPEPAWLREPDPEAAISREPTADPALDRAHRHESGPGHDPEDRRATVPTPTPTLAPGAAAEPLDDSTRVSGEATGALAVDSGPRENVCGSVVARFSTGEVVTLHGTGLIGRNPAPQEGERFDVLVRILDPARSVSKTHLEFVVDAGRLWIRDRFSGNGTILRHPNGTGTRCEGGRRYRVGEGDRIEIGEQYFDVR